MTTAGIDVAILAAQNEIIYFVFGECHAGNGNRFRLSGIKSERDRKRLEYIQIESSK